MTTKPVQLLGLATAVAALSLCLNFLVRPDSWPAQEVIGYVPIPLGFLSMWLCLKARTKATRKALVVGYAIVLAPFAFNYPAWLFFTWVLYASGRYHGPMP